MCLITKNKRVQTATEDMIVYKKVTPNLRAIFFPEFKYKIGKLYETKMTKLPKHSKKWKTFSSRDSNWCDNHFLGWRGRLSTSKRVDEDAILVRKGMMCIAKGFHSVINHEKMFVSRYDMLVECLVPKGAKYHTDETGMVVSNKIMVTKILSKPSILAYLFTSAFASFRSFLYASEWGTGFARDTIVPRFRFSRS
jgi:hypothetical protein